MTEPCAPIDRPAGRAMWAAYLVANPGTVPDQEVPQVERFGDHPALVDELLGLVMAGTKRATAGLVEDFVIEAEPLPRIGSHWLAADSTGAPMVVLRSMEFRIGALNTVDDSFAWDEGEDDRTRDSWLREHREYFRRVCAARGAKFTEEQEVVFERFAVVWPPEYAGNPGAQTAADRAST